MASRFLTYVKDHLTPWQMYHRKQLVYLGFTGHAFTDDYNRDASIRKPSGKAHQSINSICKKSSHLLYQTFRTFDCLHVGATTPVTNVVDAVICTAQWACLHGHTPTAKVSRTSQSV